MARIASTTTSGVNVGPPMTLDALMARQRQLAEAAPSANREMQSPWQGAAYLGEVLANKVNQGRIDRDLATGRQSLAEAMGGIDWAAGPTGEQVAQISALDPEQGQMMLQQLAQYRRDREARAQEAAINARELGEEQASYQRNRNDTLADNAAKQVKYGQVITGDAAAKLGLDPTKSYQQNELTRQYDPVGGGAGVTINTGDTSGALRKKFDEEEGTLWAKTYLPAGTKAAGLQGDMALLDELGKIAPQGPVPGALQKVFPGISNAGAAYAAVVKRLAPQMRVEGSGATSDIEYAGMVASLPSLSNYPAANQLIGGMIKAKAALDIERANIVTQWRNGGLKDEEARTAIQQLNSRSIMSPELRALIEQAGPAAEAGGAEGWSVEEVP